MKIQEIEQKVNNFIKTHNLITQGDEIIVATSGGADSMMLLHYLYKNKEKYKISIVASHVNHLMRAEADEDMNYVQEICNKWNIPYRVHVCDIKKLAKENKLSLEECAREVRYEFFISLLQKNSKIATAHNANDNAETMLMRFFRGTDVKGLCGIPVQREEIIRPILALTRKEIEFYCNMYNILYKVDNTNLLPIYTRNRIRLDILPYITENINQNIVHTLVEHSELYKEEEDFLESYTTDCFARCVNFVEGLYKINLATFTQEKVYIKKKLVLKVLVKLLSSAHNISARHLEAIIQLSYNQSGKKLNLPEEVEVYRLQDSLIITKRIKTTLNNTIKLEIGDNYFGNYKIILTKSKVFSKRIEEYHQNMYTKYIDYAKIKNELIIRTRQDGDKINLEVGNKKLKKLFGEEKIPVYERDSIPLIVDGDNIVYIVGSRLNIDYYIDNNTQNVLEISVLQTK